MPSLSSSHFVLSLSCCHPVLSSGCHVVPGVSELGWDKLGMGDAHHSSFWCHVSVGNVAPASLVSVGCFCVCVCPFVFILGWSSLLRHSCLLLVVLWPWLLCGVRWHVSGAHWWLSGWRGWLVVSAHTANISTY